METRPRNVVRTTAAGGGPIALHRRSPLRTPVGHHPFVNATTQVLMYTTSAPVLPLRRTYVRCSGVTVILIRFSVVFAPLDKIIKINNIYRARISFFVFINGLNFKRIAF